MASWTTAQIPDQTGRRIIVTGANSGLGEATAKALAEHGASVVLACRNTDKGKAAAARMTGDVTVRSLDLADLGSVRAFAEGTEEDVDVLVNNAGVMALPEKRTADGFEMQIGTNFLGHFALTGLLLPRIQKRVITLSSQAHRIGSIELEDLSWNTRRYRRWGAYGQSKLADLMFAFELHRRLSKQGSTVVSAAAHPGFASTELQSHTESIQDSIMSLGNRFIAQSAAAGALPALYAATVSDVGGGDYYGPGGPGEMRGHPKRVGSSRASKNAGVASRLWDSAAELTGVDYL